MGKHAAPGLGAIVLGLALVGALAGCTQSKGRNLPLDKTVARDSLKKFLETWKSGGKPSDLKNASPSIIVSDDDWNAGKKLASYTISSEEKDDGTNAHLTAELTIDGRKRNQKYIVGTSPVITIFRP
jgi:hypothetical protein